jgi:hypothetical protein
MIHRAFSLLLLVFTSVGIAADRAPVPPAEKIEQAQASLRDLYKAEFAKTKSTDRLALAVKLFQEAVDTKNDPASKIALLRVARDLAAKASDGVAVHRASEEMMLSFNMSFADAMGTALDPLVASTNSAAAAKSIAESLIVASDQARFTGDYPFALAILKSAGAAAGKAGASSTSEKVRAKVKECETAKAEFDRAKEALDAVKGKTADASANLIAGRYLAFVQQDWEAGLPLLAKGADEKLQAAADRDSKAAGGSEEDRLAVADGWYAFAATAEPAYKAGLQLRAHHWYVDVASTLSGLAKTRTEKRLAELQPIVDAKANRTELWSALRRSVGTARVRTIPAVGSTTLEKKFEESPPLGGYLVGFHYTTYSQGRLVSGIQAIYATPYGEVLGTPHTLTLKADGPRQTVRAKPGYAVSKITTVGSFDGFQPVFSRLNGTQFHDRDMYDGPQIGEFTNRATRTSGDGRLIVGLHGNLNDRTARVEAIGLMTLAELDAKGNPKNKP